MAKAYASGKKHTVTIRMGATNYDLTAVTKQGEVVNYDMSRMTKKEQKALRLSLVSAYRESLQTKPALKAA